MSEVVYVHTTVLIQWRAQVRPAIKYLAGIGHYDYFSTIILERLPFHELLPVCCAAAGMTKLLPESSCWRIHEPSLDRRKSGL